MSILHVPVTATNIVDWVRKAASSINLLIGGKQDRSDNLDSLSGLSLTGNANKSVTVKATEDGFELTTVTGGSGIADGDYGDIVVSGTGTAINFDSSVVTTFAKTFLDDADAATVRTTIGAQASDATLTALAGATWSAGTQALTLTAADTITLKTVGSASGNILDKAAGDSLYQPLDTDLTSIAGLSFSQGDILYRDGSGLQRLAAGTSGYFLKTNGTSANPSWADVAAGLTYTQPAGIPGANDTGAFATLSNAFVLSANADVYALYGMFNAANSGDTYNMFIAAVDNSGNISSTVASGSSSFTTSATGIHFRRFALSAPVTLTAGTNYIIALVLTNRTTTTACRAYLTSGSYHELPQDFAAMSTNLGGFTKRFWYTQTSSSPGSGSPVSSSTSTTQYQLGMTVKLAA